MISVAESGLTQAQYDAINAGLIAKPRFKYVISRENPVWRELARGSNDSNHAVDICVTATNLIRARISASGILVVEEYDSGWSALKTTSASTADPAVPPSLYISGTTIVVAYVPWGDLTEFGTLTSTDSGDTWGSYSAVYSSFSALQYVSMVSATRFNTVDWDGTNFASVFGVYDSTYTQLHWWPGRLTGMDSVRVDSIDYIAFCGADAPMWSLNAETVGTTNAIQSLRGGVYLFKLDRTYISGVYEVELLDDYLEYNTRDNLSLSYFNGMFVMTALASDSGEYAVGSTKTYRLYRSTTGIDWTMSDVIALNSLTNDEQRIKICYLEANETVYLSGTSVTFYSEVTEKFGAAATTWDISSVVLPGVIQFAQMQSMSLQIDRGNDALQEFPALTVPDLVLRVYYRVHVPTEGDFADVLVATMQVEDIQRTGYAYDPQLVLNCRGTISKMSNQKRAAVSFEREGHTSGADKFYQPTDKKYGGWTHFAVIDGKWATSLTLNHAHWDVASAGVDDTGIAYSTFQRNIVNGMAEVLCNFATVNNNERFGVTFWTYNKDNFWMLSYYLSTDTIYLHRVQSGTRNVIASWGSQGWQHPTVNFAKDRGLMVKMDYGKIICYKQEPDTVTWDLLGTYSVPRQADLSYGVVAMADVTPQRGPVGMWGEVDFA